MKRSYGLSLALRSGGVSFRKCCPRHTTMENIRIIVVDNQELVAVGIAARLANTPQIHVVGHAKSGKALLDGLRSTQPDLVIIDVSLHEMDGIDTTRQLRRLSPGLKVLAHSALSQIEYVNSMLIEGACGYVVKEGPREELAEAIRTVMAGGTYISPAARDSIAKGYRYTEKRVDGDYIGLTAREREVMLIALEHQQRDLRSAPHQRGYGEDTPQEPDEQVERAWCGRAGEVRRGPLLGLVKIHISGYCGALSSVGNLYPTTKFSIQSRKNENASPPPPRYPFLRTLRHGHPLPPEQPSPR